MLTFVKDVQFWKALNSIVITEFGIEVLVKALQLLKVYGKIVVINEFDWKCYT